MATVYCTRQKVLPPLGRKRSDYFDTKGVSNNLHILLYAVQRILDTGRGGTDIGSSILQSPPVSMFGLQDGVEGEAVRVQRIHRSQGMGAVRQANRQRTRMTTRGAD